MSRFAVAGALTIAGVGIQLANAGAASAQCLGPGAPVATSLSNPSTGQLLAVETPVGGACNNDGTYTATLSAADGWTPALWFQLGNPAIPTNPWGPGWAQYYGNPIVSYSAVNHLAREFLCAVNNSNGSAWCGVGNSARFLQKYDSHLLNVQTLASVGPPFVVNSGF